MNSSQASPRKIRCPRCGEITEFSPQNPHRPFCSERCQLIDLGSWADGKYAIPVKPAPDEDFSQIDIDEK